MTNTRLPFSALAVAKFTLVVVFPDPLFWFTIAIVRVLSSSHLSTYTSPYLW
jgi:hypothetical protein